MLNAKNSLPVLLSAMILSFMPDRASSMPNFHDVVRSTSNVVVVNNYGNCVRTRWNVGVDDCGAAPVEKKAEIAPRQEIAQEERTVYFGFNKATLSPESKRKLDSLAGILKTETDVKQANIVGFADRIGSPSYNEKLSQRRAEAVRKYIVSRGYTRTQVTETRWMGEDAPITQCPNTLSRPALIECLQKDRRVEVEIGYLHMAEALNRP